MTNYSAAIVTALLASTPVGNIIGSKIFLEQPPTMADFPCVTFSQNMTANSGADNAVKSVSVIFDVECWTRGGSAWALANAVEVVFFAQGYLLQAAHDVPPLDGIYQVSMTFQQTKEVI